MPSSLRLTAVAISTLLVATGIALAQHNTIDINRISDKGVGEKIGTVVVGKDAAGGVSFKIDVKGLPPGERGFHVHEKGDCGPAIDKGKITAGAAAGPHYDPDGKKSHKGPKGAGHKGDLPALKGSANGISQIVSAPRLDWSDIQGRALVIHEKADNYTDKPENGGSARRVACGVIPK